MSEASKTKRDPRIEALGFGGHVAGAVLSGLGLVFFLGGREAEDLDLRDWFYTGLHVGIGAFHAGSAVRHYNRLPTDD